MASQKSAEKIYIAEDEAFDNVIIKVLLQDLQYEPADNLGKLLNMNGHKIPISRAGSWIFYQIQDQTKAAEIITMGGDILAILWSLYISYPEVTAFVEDAEKTCFSLDMKRSQRRNILDEIGNGIMEVKIKKNLSNLPNVSLYRSVEVTVSAIVKPRTEQSSISFDPQSDGARIEKLESFEHIAILMKEKKFQHAYAKLQYQLASSDDDITRLQLLMRCSVCALELGKKDDAADYCKSINSLMKTASVQPDDIVSYCDEIDDLYHLLRKKEMFRHAADFAFSSADFVKNCPDPNGRVDKMCIHIQRTIFVLNCIASRTPGAEMLSEIRKYIEKIEKELLSIIKKNKDCSTMIKYRSLYYCEFAMTELRSSVNDHPEEMFPQSSREFNMKSHWGDFPIVSKRLELHPEMGSNQNDQGFKMDVFNISQNPKRLEKKMKDPKIAKTDQILRSNFGLGQRDEEESEDNIPPISREQESQTSNQKGAFGISIKKGTSKKEKPKKTKMEEAQEEKQKGNDAYKKKDFDEAIKCYNAAIKLDPENAMLHCNKAAVYMEQKLYPLCRATCVEAFNIANKSDKHTDLDKSKILARLARVEMKMGNPEVAYRFYERSLSYHYDDTVANDQTKCEMLIAMSSFQRFSSPMPSFFGGFGRFQGY